ncbi:MAG: hypothetical protein VKL39_18245 [Leptolyngbyaceae bacterium]|nr:hypothetical protein [Leptolyngbyaceae bacterium]
MRKRCWSAIATDGNSNLIRGDLLVIPIEESLIYVEPVYLRVEQSELPELRRVIVVHGDEVVMEESLGRSLATIFGEPTAEAIGELTDEAMQEPGQPIATGEMGSLINSVLDAYQRAQTALTEQDWQTYGAAQEELDSLMQQLQNQATAQEGEP